MSQNDLTYDLRIIRELLIKAFSASDLQRLCLDHPSFRPIVANFGIRYNLNDMIDEVIHYCETEVLWDEFLAAVKDVRPNQYARFESRLRTVAHTGSKPPMLDTTAAGPEEGRSTRRLVPLSIGMAVTIIVFLILMTARYYQAAVTLGALVLAIALCWAVYAAFPKTAQVTTDELKRLAARRRLWAAVGIVAVVAVIILAIAARPIRRFVVSAFAGTPTPTSPPQEPAPLSMPAPEPLPEAFITPPPDEMDTVPLSSPTPELLTTALIAPPPAEESALAAASPPTPRPTPVPTLANPVSTAIVRIDSETLYSGTVSELSHLLVEDQVYGHVLVVVPRSMFPEQATAIHLLVFPDAALLERNVLDLESDRGMDPGERASGTASGQEESNVDSEPSAVGSESEWVYPVMIAELNGAGFEIEPSGPQRQAVVSGQTARWSWSIWTEWTGTHELILRISTDIPLDCERPEDRLALGSIPITVRVVRVGTGPAEMAVVMTVTPVIMDTPVPEATQPPDGGSGSLRPMVVALIVVVVLLVTLTSLLLVLSVRRRRSRESAVRILEQRLNADLDQQTRAEIRQKIASLLSVKWWQFWR